MLSIWPVRIKLWVWASMPGFTRSITEAFIPLAAARVSKSRSSVRLSATILPTPYSRARDSSSTVLLLPWKTTFSIGKSAARAVYSSPAETTSSPRPSSITRRQIALQQKALEA